jgi:hypothetical protein
MNGQHIFVLEKHANRRIELSFRRVQLRKLGHA